MSEDELLDFLSQNRGKCFFPGCKKFVHPNNICTFCKEEYCFDHIQPQVHGCRDAAREKAIKDFREQQQKPSNDRKLRDYQRTYLENQLKKDR